MEKRGQFAVYNGVDQRQVTEAMKTGPSEMILLDQLWYCASLDHEEPHAEGAAIIKGLIDQTSPTPAAPGP